MARTLTSCDITSVAAATDAFGEDKGLLVCRPNRSACKPYFTIPEGCYALVTRHGADTKYEYVRGNLVHRAKKRPVCNSAIDAEQDDGTESPVWPPGFHWGAPWVQVSNLVTRQSVVFDMPVKGCKTRDNVTMEIDVAIVFRIMGDAGKGERPELVPTFVHEVGARGLEQQLRGAQEEEVRALARTMKHTEVHGLRTKGTTNEVHGTLAAMEESGEATDHVAADEVVEGKFDPTDADNAVASSVKGSSHCAKMKASLNRQFMPQGVEITAVIIQKVELPENISEQMAGKTLVISSVAEQKMNQQSEMQQIRYGEEIGTMAQLHAEEREAESQTCEQQRNECQIRLGNLKAQAAKTKTRIEADSAVSVKQIKADVELQTSRVRNSQDASATEQIAKSERTAARIRAETALYVTGKESEAALTVAKNHAEATAMLAEAEGKIAPMLSAVKMHQTEQLRLEVAASLAGNPDLVISSSSNDEVNAMMMCDAVLNTVKPGQPINRSQVLAELVMLQKGSRVYMGHEMAECAA